MSAPIGLIGLGLMGSEIAKRLSTVVTHCLGHDLDPQRLLDLATLAVKLALKSIRFGTTAIACS